MMLFLSLYVRKTTTDLSNLQYTALFRFTVISTLDDFREYICIKSSLSTNRVSKHMAFLKFV